MPETKGFTCGKWIIGYNFAIDDGDKSKFITHEELILLNSLKYKYCVNKSRDMPRDNFVRPIGGRFKKRNRAITFF